MSNAIHFNPDYKLYNKYSAMEAYLITVRFNEIRSNFFQWLPGRVCLSLSKKK